jgi:fumarylpyruvate hydrolase
MGKGFDQSAPCGTIVSASVCGHLSSGAISVAVDGEVKQSSDLNLLIWNVAEVVADLSTYNDLAVGDLIYTGTPEGVGQVARGQTVVGRVAGLPDLTIRVAG